MAHEQGQHSHDHDHAANGAGYEVEDASVREVIFTGLGLLVGTVIVCFAVAGLVKVLASTEGVGRVPVTEVPTGAQFPPAPRLQSKPWEELQVLRQQEHQSLTSYGWVNKDAGTVRIPIDRAMDIVVQKGLLARAQTPGGQGGSGRPKTGASEGNVPSQATGYPSKAAGAKPATANPPGVKGDASKK